MVNEVIENQAASSDTVLSRCATKVNMSPVVGLDNNDVNSYFKTKQVLEADFKNPRNATRIINNTRKRTVQDKTDDLSSKKLKQTTMFNFFGIANVTEVKPTLARNSPTTEVKYGKRFIQDSRTQTAAVLDKNKSIDEVRIKSEFPDVEYHISSDAMFGGQNIADASTFDRSPDPSAVDCAVCFESVISIDEKPIKLGFKLSDGNANFHAAKLSHEKAMAEVESTTPTQQHSPNSSLTNEIASSGHTPSKSKSKSINKR